MYVYVYMYVCVYVCIYIYIHARVGVHMHSCRRILFICTVESFYYMRVYHRCFLTLACVCVGGLEVGFVSACSWFAKMWSFIHPPGSAVTGYCTLQTYLMTCIQRVHRVVRVAPHGELRIRSYPQALQFILICTVHHIALLSEDQEFR